MEKIKLIQEKTIANTPRMRVAKVTFQQQDQGNKEFTNMIVRSRKSVAVLIINENDEIALIKQFRPTTGEWHIELPAVMLEHGEDMEMAAIRETEGKTGLEVKKERVYTLNKSCNYLDISKSDEDFGAVAIFVDGKPEHIHELEENEKIDPNIFWMQLEHVGTRLTAQMSGSPFFENLYMSGHSTDALLQYFFVEKSFD